MSELVHQDFRPDDGVTRGFSFENYQRNANLLNANATASAGSGGAAYVHPPKAMKTGTTIVGMIYDGGVILGADTRSTNGEEVAEKNCIKIHSLCPNMYCAGAGTSADCSKTTELVASQLELLRMETHSASRVVTALTLLKRMLFRYQGQIGAHLILGGVDLNGPHLYQIHSHGSTGRLPFTTMGSGSLAAMAVFESSWRQDMPEQEAVQMVHRAVAAGIFNDLGSGSNVDVCIIRNNLEVDYRRNDVKPNEIEPLKALIQRSNRFILPPGVTPVLKTDYLPHPKVAASLADVTEMEVESS
jgi:20S proteasome subunit beta 2